MALLAPPYWFLLEPLRPLREALRPLRLALRLLDSAEAISRLPSYF